MNEDFNAVLSIALVPNIIELISEKEPLDEMTAMNEFYHSEVYALLSCEETKLWHYSPLMLYTMWKHEKDTGKPFFPEG